jgi:DNA-binding beta-propeller fold protein YncE
MKVSALNKAAACAVATFAAAAIAAAMSFPSGSLAQGNVPRYEVDMAWPKPLPDRWVIGGLGGTCVDARDHVFILNRQDVLEGELLGGQLAPSIIEFDPAGNVVNSWGDPNLLDPRLHSCHFDKDNNVWIAASPSGMVQKYSHDGSKMLLQLGKKGVFDSSDGTAKGTPLNSNATQFYMPSSIHVDRQNGDIYVSDGESSGGNKRVAVIDQAGKFLRQWQPEGMTTVHCMIMANDGMVYVCNRAGGKIQIYDKQGSLKKTLDVPWKPVTAAAAGKPTQNGGAAVAIAFSADPAQRHMFVVNQNSAQIEIMERETGKTVGSFGRVGRYPGEFDQAHGIAADSKGNIFVAENRGRRIQKFKIAGQ